MRVQFAQHRIAARVGVDPSSFTLGIVEIAEDDGGLLTVEPDDDYDAGEVYGTVCQVNVEWDDQAESFTASLEPTVGLQRGSPAVIDPWY